MTTALDASALWAILKNEATAAAWEAALIRAAAEGPLVISPLAFAELAPSAADVEDLNDFLLSLQIRFDPIHRETAFAAGTLFRQYRQAGGPREHLIPDFCHRGLRADASGPARGDRPGLPPALVSGPRLASARGQLRHRHASRFPLRHPGCFTRRADDRNPTDPGTAPP
jgi:predicted nucleic acid-binding protein